MKGSRECYGCGGSGQRGIFECAVCSGTGTVTGPPVQAHADTFRAGTLRTAGPAAPEAEARAEDYGSAASAHRSEGNTMSVHTWERAVVAALRGIDGAAVPDWTEAVLRALASAGNEQGFKSSATGGTKVGAVWQGWLWDCSWREFQDEESWVMLSVPMVAECEWGLGLEGSSDGLREATRRERAPSRVRSRRTGGFATYGGSAPCRTLARDCRAPVRPHRRDDDGGTL